MAFTPRKRPGLKIGGMRTLYLSAALSLCATIAAALSLAEPPRAVTRANAAAWSADGGLSMRHYEAWSTDPESAAPPP